MRENVTRPSRWGWRTAAVVTASAVVATASACGSSESASTAAPVADTAPVETLAPAAPTRFSPSRAYQWGLETDDGLKAALGVAFGTLAPAGTDPARLPEEFGGLLANCAVDPERDALLPVQLQVTNTTDGFSISPTVELRHDGRGAGTIEGASGSSCSQWDVYEHLGWNSIEPRGERTFNWLLILKDFYLPDMPSGDFTAFGDDRVRLKVLEGDLTEDQAFEPTCLTSPPASGWRGDWTSSLQAHFPILEGSREGFEEVPDELLPDC